jgi:hypothetical protein
VAQEKKKPKEISDVANAPRNEPPESTPSPPVDIAIYAGAMDVNTAAFLQWCRKPAAHKNNCIIILATLGGNASVAYRISRALQKNTIMSKLLFLGYAKAQVP